MIHRYTSSKEILAKVYRDLKLPEDRDSDILEWIGEALEFIGSGAAFELKGKDLIVTNFRAPMPCDLLILKRVYDGSQSLTYGRKVSQANIGVSVSAATGVLNIKDNGRIVTGGSSIKGQLDGYFINGGYIILPFESGRIYIEYEGFKLDDNGFPMIPDAVQYRNAVFNYILRQLIMGGYKHPDPQLNYFNVDLMWKRSCLQAQVHGGFPSVDKSMEFGRKFASMIPVIRSNEMQLRVPEDVELPNTRTIRPQELDAFMKAVVKHVTDAMSKVYALDDEVVHKLGDEIIYGIKTFKTIIEAPSIQPEEDSIKVSGIEIDKSGEINNAII